MTTKIKKVITAMLLATVLGLTFVAAESFEGNDTASGYKLTMEVADEPHAW